MTFSQLQPFIHQRLFSCRIGFLLKENSADRLVRNGGVFLAEEAQRLPVKIFQRPCVESRTLHDDRVSADAALAHGRASAPCAQRSLACFANKAEQLVFTIEK